MSLDLLEDLPELERVPVCVVLWKWQWIVDAAGFEELLVLFESVLEKQVLFVGIKGRVLSLD